MTTPPDHVNASHLSRLLVKAGHTRSRTVPGGRSGVLSPVTVGFRLRQFSPTVVQVYWRGSSDAERRQRLAEIGAELAGLGYRADPDTVYRDIPILRVTRPA